MSLGDLYIDYPTKAGTETYLLFVHGGPGGSSQLFEYFAKNSEDYRNSDIRWIFYDQRGCGRSSSSNIPISHQQNLDDLQALVHEGLGKYGSSFKGIVGHSYGGRLLYDFCLEYPELPLSYSFVGRSLHGGGSINSLVIDMLGLRTLEPMRYENFHAKLSAATAFEVLDALDIKKQFSNPEQRATFRDSFYWGNVQTMKKCNKIKRDLNIRDNNEAMDLTIKSIVASPKYADFNFDLGKIHRPTQLAVGFFDFLMNGFLHTNSSQKNVKVFYGSGHYPHMEQPQQFIPWLRSFFA